MSSLNISPIGVEEKGLAFLIDRLFADCSPNQILREFGQNCIEAIFKRDGRGDIHVDFDHAHYDATGVKKLCFIDNGIGMTGVEMYSYLNHLSSSALDQHLQGNFGIGGKITSIPLNPFGVVYRSWKDGKGYMMVIIRDDDNGYGAVRDPSTGEFWFDLESEPHASNPANVKPDMIKGHGTKVTFLGEKPESETFAGFGETKEKAKWLAQYITTRYFEIPSNIKVQCRERYESENDPKSKKHLRTVHGQKYWNDINSENKGQVALPLNEVIVHWWILKPSTDRKGTGRSAIDQGHMAVLLDNELTSVVSNQNTNRRDQKAFGIAFSAKRVILYIEPTNPTAMYNSARDRVKVEGNDLMMDFIGEEFIQSTPQEIRDLEEDFQSKNAEKRGDEVRDMLKKHPELYSFARYRLHDKGDSTADSSSNVGGSGTTRTPTGERGGKKNIRKNKRRGNAGEALKALGITDDDNSRPAKPVDSMFEPVYVWVGEGEHAEREEDQLEDRAAEYDPVSNVLTINADFRVFQGMKWYFLKLSGESKNDVDEGVMKTVWSEMKTWIELQLTEVLVSVRALKSSGTRWSDEEVKSFYHEDSLTAAVLPRFAIYHKIKTSLGRRLTFQD